MAVAAWTNRSVVLPKPATSAGFTLMELIIVCLLISLMLVFSVPSLREAMLDNPLKSGCRAVIGIIRSTRDQAVRERKPYLIYFDLAGGRIWSDREPENNSEEIEVDEKTVYTLPASVRLHDIWTRTEGVLERGQAELWISGQGYMDQSVIHLEDNGGEVLSVILSPFLGTIKVREGYVDGTDL